MSELFDVKDKAIVITGGAGTLCGTIARQLARHGAKICVVDYDVFRANELCKQIEAEGNFAIPVEANVLDKEKIQEAFAWALGGQGLKTVIKP